MAVTGTWLHFLFERHVCQTYNELSRILKHDLKLKEHSRFYCLAFLAKVYNFFHNFNFALSAIMHWGLRPFNVWDLLANLYFVYNSLARDAILVAYVLLLLNLSEALRLNGQQEHDTYSDLMKQLRRRERLLRIGRRVHRMFAWLVAIALIYLVFFNTATIYLGYTMFIQKHDALGLRGRGLKMLLTVVSFLVILWDVVLLQVICEKLLAEENKICDCPEDVASSRTTYRQVGKVILISSKYKSFSELEKYNSNWLIKVINFLVGNVRFETSYYTIIAGKQCFGHVSNGYAMRIRFDQLQFVLWHYNHSDWIYTRLI